MIPDDIIDALISGNLRNNILQCTKNIFTIKCITNIA